MYKTLGIYLTFIDCEMKVKVLSEIKLIMKFHLV